MRHSTQRVLPVAIAGLLLSSVCAAQRPSLGPQFGFATNDYDIFLGAQVSIPIAPRFDFYPSFDVYFPGQNVTAWALNGDVRFWPRLTAPNAGLFVGGGLSYTHVSVDLGPTLGTASGSDGGLGLLAGWEFRTVSSRPFTQLRVILGDADRVEFSGGLSFRM